MRQFLDYLRLEKHFSDYTVKSYGADLIQFGQFLKGEIGRGVSNGVVGGDGKSLEQLIGDLLAE